MKNFPWLDVVIVAVLVLVLGALAWNFDPFGRRHRAEQRATGAEAQSTVSQGTAKAVDHYVHDLTIIHDKTQKAQDAVQAAPGADSPLPDDVRNAWLNGLRDIAGSSPSAGPGKPSN